MSDRRQTDRTPIQTSCTLALGGRKVAAVIVNLSDQGALLGFAKEAGEVVPDEELGTEASFLLPTVTPQRLYTGEIIRSYFLAGAQQVALRFWKKYTLVP
jgi:hypothetical protein